MKILKKLFGGGQATAPVPREVEIAAPIAGRLVDIAEVPDPVFAQRVLGDGFAIDPSEGVLCAPFDGKVIGAHRARHAITLRAANGAEVLMHVGVDTVALNGDGFTVHVADGAAVRKGDPLISFDAAAIAPRVPSLMIPFIVTNGFALTARTAAGPVARGASCGVLAPA